MQGSPPSDRELRRLLDAVSEGLALCREGRVVWANRAFVALVQPDLDEDPATLTGMPLQELFRDVGFGLPGEPQGRPVECLTGRAVPVWVEPLPLEGDGKHDGVRVRPRDPDTATEHDELLTVVSHELRTPVTVIAGYNRLLLSEKVGALNPQQCRFLRESQKSCERLNQFIANLLERAREVVGSELVEVEIAPLEPVLRSAIAALAPLLEEQALRVSLDVPATLPDARFDRLRLERVLDNLLGNALKYSPSGGRIGVRARTVDAGGRPFVEVSIEDEGPGVPTAERERIFHAYVRGDAGSGAGGLGLGLSIARRLVTSQGGTLGVEGSPRGGSRFFFTLPADDGSVA